MKTDLSKPAPGRRWQFSLRTLLGVITLAALFLGREVERARRQKHVADAVRSGVEARWDSGGLVRYAGERSQASPRPTHDWIARVLGRDFVDTVEFVNLRPCYMTEPRPIMGHAPSGLESLTDLRGLDVEGTDFDDDYLARITALRKLVELDVRNTRVSSIGVALFRRAMPRCRVFF